MIGEKPTVDDCDYYFSCSIVESIHANNKIVKTNVDSATRSL